MKREAEFFLERIGRGGIKFRVFKGALKGGGREWERVNNTKIKS